MKPVHVFLQALLVAAGLFVYDQVRSPESRSGSSGVANGASAPETAESRVDTAESVAEAAALGRRLAALERTVADLVAAGDVTAPRGPEADVSASPREGAAASLPEAGAIDVPSTPPIPDASFGEEEIARFRALQQAARRQARLERVRDLAGRALDRIPGVSLSAEERRLVVEESLRAWLRARSVKRLDAGAAAAASKTLRADYLAAVRGVVRGSHADVIGKQLTSLLGLTASALRGDESEDG